MMKCGDQPRQPHSLIHRRKALLKRSLNRSVQKRFLTTVESQLVVRGQALIEGSTPDRTRTCDLRFRKPTLYPPELRGRLDVS